MIEKSKMKKIGMCISQRIPGPKEENCGTVNLAISQMSQMEKEIDAVMPVSKCRKIEY